MTEPNVSNLNKKSSDDELFFYLADQLADTTERIYDSSLHRRRNILTVMSFCLIGEITFLANPGASNTPYKILILVSLACWLLAFILTIHATWRTRETALFPGPEEGFTFLASAADINEYKKRIHMRNILKEKGLRGFREAWKSRFSSSMLLDIQLKRLGHIYPPQVETNYSELVVMYNKAVGESNDLAHFNKNAWLGSLSRILGTALALDRSLKNEFCFIYILFTANIITFLSGLLTAYLIP